MSATASGTTPQAALLRQPWQLRRSSRSWPLMVATPALLALPPLAVAWLRGLSPAGTLAAVGLVWLTWLWWMQADGLMQQNRPALARLMPGHAAALRRSLLLQALLLGAAAVALLGLMLGTPLRWLWLVLPTMVVLAWLAREPWLWLAFGMLSPLLGGLRAHSEQMSALPLGAQALAAMAWLAVLALCVGQGGRLHRWADTRQRRWQRSWQAMAEGRPAPSATQSPLERALQRPFDWPVRWWRDRVLAAPARAPWPVRLELGLDTGGRWLQLLWIGLLVLVGSFTLLNWTSRQYGQTMETLVDHGRLGLGLGLYGMLAGTLYGRLGQLWARRREQALLVLLPALPAGGEVAALERRWQRQWLLAWVVATALALGVGSLGSPGTLDYIAFCAAASLPLGWAAQFLQRRLQRSPRMLGLTLVPPAAAVLAFAVERLGVPAWASLAVGALVYAAGAAAARPGALWLPVARSATAA